MRFFAIFFILLSIFSSCKKENQESKMTKNWNQKITLNGVFSYIEENSKILWTYCLVNNKNISHNDLGDIYIAGSQDVVKEVVFRKGGVYNIEIGLTTYNEIIEELGPPDEIENPDKIIYKNGNRFLYFFFDKGILGHIVYNNL